MDRGLRDAAEAGGARHGRPTSRGISEILAFLENEIGMEALKRQDYAEAARRFEAAIDARSAERAGVPESRRRPLLQEDTRGGDRRDWERLVETSPERAYLAFARLESAYADARPTARSFPRSAAG